MSPLALFTGPYGALARIGLIAIAGFGIWLHGWYHGNEHGGQKLVDYLGKQATADTKLLAARVVVTEKIQIKYVKQAAATQVVTNTVEKEVVRYETVNTGYCLDSEWRRLHDTAALNKELPQPETRVDDASGAPKAAPTLATVTTNYAACHRTADKLDALQQWIIEQQAVK